MTTEDRVNASRSSYAIKAPCRVATTAAITLSGEQTIDGVAIVTGDRVLVKNQTAGADNGIYIADTSTWQRAPDCDGTRDMVQGTRVAVVSGTTSAELVYKLTTANPITVGSTSIAFAVVTGASILTLPIPISQGGTGAASAAAARTALDAQQNVITTRGDIIRGSAAGIAERLALGTSGQVLTSNGTDAAWAAPPSSSTLGTAVLTTSGTSVAIASGLPTGLKRIIIALNGVGTNGTSALMLQIGDSGGLEITNYAGNQCSLLNPTVTTEANASSAGFLLQPATSNDAADTHMGVITLMLENAASNTWIMTSQFNATTRSAVFIACGKKALSGVLDRLSITTAGGVNTFDAGEINIRYE